MKIGVIGTGLMGAPMTLRLLSCGHQVWVYNRTVAQLKPLELSGATVCQTPLELVQAVDAVVLMVANAEVIQTLLLENLALNPEDNSPSPLGQCTLIQMGTISPGESQALHQVFTQMGATYLEAPVLGSIPEAKNGRLIVMVGAEPDQYKDWRPLLKSFGTSVYHVGPVGTAAALKLALNQMIGSMTTAFAQSLGLVQAYGIDVDTFMTVVRQSALYASTFDKKLPRMETRNFADPNFPAKHLLKDMGLFTEAAQAMGLETLAAESVRQLVEQAVEAGLGDDDYSSIFNIISAPPES